MGRLTNTELRQARRIIGLSGQELANRLGVRADTLRRWEAGREPVPYGVRNELAAITGERLQTLGSLRIALDRGEDFPLTPETVVVSKGWKGSLQEVQDWLWDGNHIIEANLIARLREEGRIPSIDEDDDDAVEADEASFLSVLPALTLADVRDVLDDPQARLN